jgi:transaldolase/glucose-6-phosphate isomerase
MTNPVRKLGVAGQAVWLDYLHRRILENGELERLIAEDDLCGMTSNPAIFEQAIGGGDDYDGAIAACLERGDAEPMALYEHLAIADIQAAADQFRPLWEAQAGSDGYVSLEVSPYLAMDTEATIAEARRLWRAVDRPNLMIKVPGTKPGVPAIRALIAEGININVTLLFGIEAYLAVADAHMAGLEDFRTSGGEVATVHGVASFFVSRIDTSIDRKIDARAATDPEAAALKALRGKVAIANAKVAYQHYLEMMQSPRWRALAAAGAAPQRLLWASTGTKDPAYSDVLYVENLIGPDTVDTMPPMTLQAFKDHGLVRATLVEDVDGARHVLKETERLGLDLAGVTEDLVTDGVAKFAQAFDALLAAVAGKRVRFLGERLNSQDVRLPADLRAAADQTLQRAADEGWVRRLWAKDASLWTGGDEGRWLGWLGAASGGAVSLAELERLAARVSANGYGHALLLGMGGSSLGPEVLSTVFGPAAGHPPLLVLDSTDPAQIARIDAEIDPANTLFIVSSKSGSTLEPDLLHRHFRERAEAALGKGAAGQRFVAVTDPGSALERTARADGFAEVLPGDPAIGGRYSVMSNFGMAAAAVLGLDLRGLVATASIMARACAASAPPAANPGFELGVALGAAALAGRDKVTFVSAYEIAPLGAWLEQLLAESTGKHGKGLIPVDAEPLGEAGAYGHDRVFVFLHLTGRDDPQTAALARELETAGHPVVHITLASRNTLAQEFVRWEVAVAVAGAVLGIDPFDQPDVEASKVKARELTDAYESGGAPAAADPLYAIDGIALYADGANAKALSGKVGQPSLENYLNAHFARAGEGDYAGLLAWMDREEAHTSALQEIRAHLRDRLKTATVLGFGPRFLHSTGQAYKGGPNSGVFLEITAQPARDLPVPGRRLSFGQVEAAQALGDMAVLGERGRRVLRVHLGGDIEAGLDRLGTAIKQAIP